jgi:ATP-dependent helicase/nuclease subunit A
VALTNEQLLVKDTRGKNMLVSAAAGSGKTFVLVQRIISRILEKNGIDVDQILVVTFTNAAAAEMKDRIRRAIDKAILTEGADARIRTQATLIHSAHIRTIDSFCSWIVKNYFYEIDMDPAFRIGTTGEMKLLYDEIFNDLLAEYLDANDADFKLLADAYISGRKTDALKDMVVSLHYKATSFAWVDEWYDNVLGLYNVDSVEALENSEAIRQILVQTDLYTKALVEALSDILALYEVDCDSKDKQIFTNELRQLQGVLSATTFAEKYAAISGCDFSTRFSSKGTTLDEDSLERAKTIRAQYKDLIKTLKSDYYSQDLQMMFEDISFVKKQASALIAFTRDFSNRLYESKKKKNIYEFNDIEHMALEILRMKDSVNHEKRPVAIELSNHFKEVMVDEYQDSNELQEQILTAIATDNNYFTVGDVKQSIYAFRQASPKLFIDKLYSYPMDGATDSIRIDLDKNFRSRGEVLEFSNKVFDPLMQMDVGGVAYDEKASLKVGDTTFTGDTKSYESEVIVVAEDSDAMKELSIKSADELEALVVADRIKKLMASDFQVSYKQDDVRALRSAKLSDIVILMRSVKGHADKFINVLKDHGIPAYVAEETGFFEREEIETVLSFLTVIDNPYNDIPLAAVLHSPMFNFTSEELAKLRTVDTKVSLYEAMKIYNEAHPSDDINAFFETLDYFRNQAVDTPIHEVIIHILERTGFGTYTKALPNGKMASANLDKLVDEAVSFESTSFKGLSRFVSYIESLKTYDEDLGLAKTVGENDEAVRIMSIHKSKGLEYPVVFVSGMGKGFQADKGGFSYDDNLGIALKYRNPVTRIAHDTPLFNLVKAKTKEEDRGEYLRILYVALTRAVDKLIITGTLSSSKKSSTADKVASFQNGVGPLDYPTKMSATTGMELILRALYASKWPYSNYSISIVEPGQIFVNEVENTLQKGYAKETLKNLLDSVEPSDDNVIVNTLSFTYDGIKDSAYKSKYSVSEIKHQAMEDAFNFNADAAPAFIHKDESAYIPSFMREQTESTSSDGTPAGALYGTAMHRFMECFDFTVGDLLSSFNEQLDYMHSTHALSEDEYKRISTVKLKSFMKDDVATRMADAAVKGKLYKEKPFVFGSNALELFEDETPSDEMILVQGIIDVFFEEDDGIVLLDYKTDRVDDKQELVLRYEKQLQLYKDAIEHAYEVPVKEVLIYSFAFDETIKLDV